MSPPYFSVMSRGSVNPEVSVKSRLGKLLDKDWVFYPLVLTSLVLSQLAVAHVCVIYLDKILAFFEFLFSDRFLYFWAYLLIVEGIVVVVMLCYLVISILKVAIE